MTDWSIGDRVEVYDPDEGVWIDGEVETLGHPMTTRVGASPEEYMTVLTDKMAFDLPLVMGIPVARPDLIRRRGARG